MADIPNQPSPGAIPNNLATGQSTVTTSSSVILSERAGDNATGATNRGIRKAVTFTNTSAKVDLNRSWSGQVLDGASSLSTGDGKLYILIPSVLNGWDLTSTNAGVGTAGSTGTTTVQIARIRGGATVDMLSGLISIASGDTVGTAGTINTSNDDVATNDLIRIDVDSIQSGTAPKGLFVNLEFSSASGTNDIYIGPSGSENFLLKGGYSVTIESTAAIYAKTTSGTATINYVEIFFTTG